jgi:PAS domain S-box-containing protein
MAFPSPIQDEQHRIEILRQYAVLDTGADQLLDELTGLAAYLCDAPISLISLVDERRQWFKSKIGLEPNETPREISFCTHAIRQADLFIVPDARRDERFAESPIVADGPGICFYAGAPLLTEEGAALGTLCVMDREPRDLNEKQKQGLRVLSRQVMAQLERSRQTRELADRDRLLRAIFDTDSECVKLLRRDGTLRMMNRAGLEMIEADSFEEIAGQSVYLLVAPEHRVKVQASVERVFCGESIVIEFQIVSLKGSTYWVEAYLEPLRDARGTVTEVLGITRDITERHRAEDARRLSETRLATIFHSNPAAIAITSVATGRLVDVNERFCEFFGWERAEAIGRTVFELGAWVDERQRGRLIERFDEMGAARDVEVQLRRKSGEIREVLLSMARVEMVGEQEPMLVTMFTDVTARKQAEQAVSGQKEILEMIARGTPLPEALAALVRFIETQADGMLASVLLLDEDGVHLRHGAAPSLPVEYIRAIDGASIGPCAGSCGTAAYRREPVIVEDIATDPLWADYHRLALPHGLRACWSTPIMDSDLQVLGTFALYFRTPGRPVERHLQLIHLATQTAAIAISRYRSEEALRRSEARLAAAQQRAHLGSWELDLATMTASYSTEMSRLLGMDPTRPFPTFADFLEMVHPEDRAGIMRMHARIPEAVEPITHEYRTNPANGAVRHLSATVHVLRDPMGRAVQAVGATMDVTDRRRLEEQFRQSQKMEAVGQLASGVAHDFNNLLTVIQGNASLLLLTDVDPAGQRECADEIMRASERASALTRQLLLFSRKQRMQPADLDLNEVVGNMTKMLQRILGEDIALRAEYAPCLPLVHADTGMIEQALLNLAVNSRDALPRGGQLSISTCARTIDEHEARLNGEAVPGPSVCLCVSDNGSGISPEVLPHIFEPFFTTKEVGKGTGLGLATVYGIVAQHHGWLTVESGVGQGTTVRIFLPATERERAGTAGPVSRADLPGGDEAVLVVEDESCLRRIVDNVLRRFGYTVFIADTGAAALEVWRQHRDRIHLVLTDMVMPGGISGRELIERLQVDRPGLKFIYTSGYSAELTGKGLALVDGVNFLQKPYNLQKLAHTVRACLDGA